MICHCLKMTTSKMTTMTMVFNRSFKTDGFLIVHEPLIFYDLTMRWWFSVGAIKQMFDSFGWIMKFHWFHGFQSEGKNPTRFNNSFFSRGVPRREMCIRLVKYWHFSCFKGCQEGPSGAAFETLPVHWSPAVLTFLPSEEPLSNFIGLQIGSGKV